MFFCFYFSLMFRFCNFASTFIIRMRFIFESNRNLNRTMWTIHDVVYKTNSN